MLLRRYSISLCKAYIFVFLLLPLIGFTPTTQSSKYEDINKNQSEYDSRFDAIRNNINKLVIDGKIPSMSVAVAHQGKVIWEESFGWADIENKTHATPMTMYRLGSTAKPITATGLMILEEGGLFNLHSPINKYLGLNKLKLYRGREEDVTVKSVLNHRSGLPPHCDYFFVDDIAQRRSFSETVDRYGIVMYEPGSFIYCNLGYQLIAHAISNISGMSFGDFIKENVFLPLGMSHAQVVDSFNDLSHASVVCYTPELKRIPQNVASYPGASDVYCSTHDLLKFAMFHLKNRSPDQTQILTDESISKMQINDPPSNTRYGLGWYFDIDNMGMRSLQHGGSAAGVSNFFRLIPSEDLAIVLLCNSDLEGSYLIDIQDKICEVLIDNYYVDVSGDDSVRDPQNNDQPEIPKELIGEWEGEIITYEKPISVRLQIKGFDNIKVTLTDQPTYDVNVIMATSGFIFVTFPGEIPTPDNNRFPTLEVRLAMVRDKNQLSGQATVKGWREDRQASYELSSWIELNRINPY